MDIIVRLALFLLIYSDSMISTELNFNFEISFEFPKILSL